MSSSPVIRPAVSVVRVQQRLYHRYVGPVESGFDLHHRCHNGTGGCVNLEHLEPVPYSTHRTSHAQTVLGKLTVEAAAEIRRLLIESDLSMTEIGDRYGVSCRLIQDVARGTTWRQATKGEPLAYIKRCPHCAETFVANVRFRRFCSKHCQARFNDRLRTERRRQRKAAA